METEIKAATDCILGLVNNKEVPPEFLGKLIADRIRMACAETIRVQANHLHGIANKLACQ